MLEHVDSCGHGDVVRACRQTAGRGRFQRPWVAPGDRCLTFSVLFRGGSEDDWLHPVIGQAAALAVRAALEPYSLPALLKWPNDVLVRAKKIAGILAEKTPDGRGVVLGIGLNVNLTEADLAAIELLQPATSVRIETGQAVNLEGVFAALLEALQTTLDLARRNGMSYLRKSWQPYDALSGRTISVHTVDATISGLYTGMDAEGRLCLKDDAGRDHVFGAGDVSVRGL
jgi:BirA family biotin operon repressor/biotin-[acetyl-CoA-carboxylase] ligase